MKKEQWRIIPGKHTYQVSSFGRIKNTQTGSIRKCGTNRYGYVLFNSRFVHYLVLEAFVGARPAGLQCNHKDGCKQNNKIENLEWVSPSENMRHAYRTGLRTPQRGEKSHMWGKHLSAMTKHKLSEAFRGEKHPMWGKHRSLETRQKLSKANYGKKHSEETRQKISESLRGERHPFFGKHHSVETIRKMSKPWHKKVFESATHTKQRRVKHIDN